MSKRQNFQDLFQGFQSSQELWHADAVYDLEQFYLKPTTSAFILKSDPKKLRLGKWVEQFVAFQLKQDPAVQILEENLQIKDSKVTIGELDVVLLKHQQYIHLEIVYKFYLYDTTTKSSNALAHWIGPNLKDSLIYKLNKLKEKQLPLLYHPKTEDALQHYDLDVKSITQYVCFKAQLFLPFGLHSIDITPLNLNCVVGWYLSYKDLSALRTYQFYIPEKLDWLCHPKHDVRWLSFEDAQPEIQTQIKNERSPMCWVKKTTSAIEKCFITWW